MVAVSFLTTNYNKGDVLERSLPTVLANLPSNGELIVVDGESTDNSKAILERFARRDARLRVIARSATIGEGRRIAFENATGEVVVQQIDTDRVYDRRIPELLSVFDTLIDRTDDAVLLTFDSLYIGKRATFERIGGYPPLARVDERVLVDRIFENATPRVLPVSISEELDTADTVGLANRIGKWRRTSRALRRAGFSLDQVLTYNHRTFPATKAVLSDLVTIVGWHEARGGERYGDPRRSWREVESWQGRFVTTDAGRERYRRIRLEVPEALRDYRVRPNATDDRLGPVVARG